MALKVRSRDDKTVIQVHATVAHALSNPHTAGLGNADVAVILNAFNELSSEPFERTVHELIGIGVSGVHQRTLSNGVEVFYCRNSHGRQGRFPNSNVIHVLAIGTDIVDAVIDDDYWRQHIVDGETVEWP